MGITVEYKTVTPEDFERLKNDSRIAELFYEAESDFSLNKSWHVIHYLLTDQAGLDNKAFTDLPLGSVVMGGTSTQFEATFGMIRYLKPEEVSIIAKALSNISLEGLEAKCKADSFNDADIYPLGGRVVPWDEESVEEEILFLRFIFPSLVNFFQQASHKGHVILVGSF